MLDVQVEDSNFGPAQVVDAAAWRDRNNLTFPVLADSEEAWVSVWGDPRGGNFTQHSYTLLDPDGIVVWRRLGSTRANVLIQALEDNVP